MVIRVIFERFDFFSSGGDKCMLVRGLREQLLYNDQKKTNKQVEEHR
jgi:hypothetical protein